MLVILDGWGIGSVPKSDAIQQANTPYFDSLMQYFPNAQLTTFGLKVGLPEGQMGNSEVGHLNLGAGRVVYQDLVMINKSIEDQSLKSNKVLQELITYCSSNAKPLHLIGLVSDGGVHSHIDHLKALIDICESSDLTQIYIHAITDGRDTDPKSGLGFITDLQQYIEGSKSKIISIIGRYYAMDRDHRWERTAKAYQLLTQANGNIYHNPKDAILDSYNQNITDEFIEPITILNEQNHKMVIAPNDGVLCFNFRTDRLRQLSEVLTQKDVIEYGMHKMNLQYITMTRYDSTFEHIQVLFEKQNLSNTLGEMISKYGGHQLRIAETEKYPHVSFFFSGGREKMFANERRILVPSPKVATYDLQAEMSAIPLTDALIKDINNHQPDFVCLNYANADMVGHTGVFSAVVKAVETVDQCLSQLIPLAQSHGYSIIILADHGNADYMINEDGSPNTAHSKNPVPIISITNDKKIKIKDGILGDVAPTILAIMELPKPVEMSGQNLISHL